MPTVLKIRSFRFAIRFNDHAPAHVHVYKGGGQAKIEIGAAQPRLMRVWNMSASDVRTAIELATDNYRLLVTEWKKIHG